MGTDLRETAASRIGVTVIMPVYNSAEYLLDAVVSILAEKSKCFELLLIDDGSTDDSGLLCDAIAEVDERVSVLHKENGGMCQARNYGIAHARGEYVTFCDNDDYIWPGFVQDNYEIAQKTGADCVRFGRVLKRVDDNGRLLMEVENKPTRLEVLECEKVFDKPSSFYYGSLGVWTGLYKVKFLQDNGIVFDERLRSGYEDAVFNHQVYLMAKNVAFNPRSYYTWIRRSSHSSSMRLSDNHLLGLECALGAFSRLVEMRAGTVKAPDFCSSWMIDCAKDCLTIECYASGSSASWDSSNYRKVQSIMQNYEHIVFAGNPQLKLRVIRNLLFAERYSALRAYVRAGVEYKKVTRRLFGK